MKIKKVKIGDKEVMPFTIPSGIITTEVSCLERIAREIPEIGILTTKSIGPEPRAGNREPILAQYMPGGFVNAVGLTNPGAEEFAKKLNSINFPSDKFLLVSIFGKNADEFVYAAKTLEKYADGFELNLSCPHAKGYGMQLGQDSAVVGEITKKVSSETKKPVFAKLTPNAGNIAEIAESAMKNGAYGITAINTVGPGYYAVDGNPVLTNKVGGMSGAVIKPIGLKCVRDITQKLGNIPIIAMGGISHARDVEDYASVGAKYFGIGSALAGMTEKAMKEYFSRIIKDLNEGGDNASIFLEDIDMRYMKFKIHEKIDTASDFSILKTNEHLDAEPGQFVFAWIPGVGEKPFSVMDNDPFTLGILKRGEFTTKINSLKEGDEFYIRGPYGQGVNLDMDSKVVLVGGGCGIAGIYTIAKQFWKKNVTSLLAAKDKKHLFYLNEFSNYGLHAATEDGSLGKKGMITDLFKNISGDYFFNCGPKAMVDAVLPLELKLTSPEKIYSSVDYMTRCGVGICGSCADKKGRRTCVEGPFMNY
jgi:dihydroorotate dehydrogenase (NAD+) catalytic subunit